MGRFAGLAAVALVLWSCGAVTGQQTQGAKGSVLAETGRVYALVETSQAAEEIKQSSRQLGYMPLPQVALGGLGLFMVPVDLPDGVAGLTAINALEAAVEGATVGVNHAYRQQLTQKGTTTDDDPRSYANAMLKWPHGGCRARISIGMIDGGLDTSDPSLSGVRTRVRSFGNGSPQSVRHGTEVASVLVDKSRIKNATLFSANVIETNPAGEDLGGAAALVQAINWMADQKVSLVNVSLAGPPNKLLAQALEVAAQRGILIVAAVGNNGRNAPAQFPAAHPSVIAVTAIDARGRIYRDAVRGKHVDISAPGVDIYTSTRAGERFVSGTSMAAPFVTSLLATQRSRSKSLAIQGALDLGPAGKDTTFGNGLIQSTGTCP